MVTFLGIKNLEKKAQYKIDLIYKKNYSTSQDQSPCLLQYAYNFDPFIYLNLHSAFYSGDKLTL